MVLLLFLLFCRSNCSVSPSSMGDVASEAAAAIALVLYIHNTEMVAMLDGGRKYLASGGGVWERIDVAPG